jgi:hypothetical protein
MAIRGGRTGVGGIVGRVAKAGNAAQRAKEARRLAEAQRRAAIEAQQVAISPPSRQKMIGQFQQKPGQPVIGAPRTITSEEDLNRIIEAYVDRIMTARQAGVPPGYFYGEGSQAINQVSDAPETADLLSRSLAATSATANVRANTGFGISAVEQNAMGSPVKTGRRPNAMARSINTVIDGNPSDLGMKTGPYEDAIRGRSPANSLSRFDGQGGLGVNDMWEALGAEFPEPKVSGQAQHRFLHGIRQHAVERYGARTGEQLTPVEAQELNWLVKRNSSMGLPIAVDPNATIHQTLPMYRAFHTWESQPGKWARNLPESTGWDWDQKQKFHDRTKEIYIDPETGKDRLVGALGGKLQYPASDGPGVFEGGVNPGTQSQSLVGQTMQAMLPESEQRLRATELLRSLFLGQDAGAAHSLVPGQPTSAGKATATRMDIGRTLTPDEASQIDSLLSPKGIGLASTEYGGNLLKLNDKTNLPRETKNAIPALHRILGETPKIDQHVRQGVYEGLPWYWQRKQATKKVLSELNKYPALREGADSQVVRDMAGQQADLYRNIPGTLNPRLLNLLDAWNQGGVSAAEELVRKGLAPSVGAASLLLLGQEEEEPPLRGRLGPVY